MARQGANRKILVTSALPYINNVPHMGHMVGSHLPADIFARCARAKGFDTRFIGGSDEHGTPSVVVAKELGVSPKQLVDRLHLIHKRIYDSFGISYDVYSRTSSSGHHDAVKAFFKKVDGNGFIIPGKNEMLYCEKDGLFLPDRFVTGTCPSCGYEGANGDQCEECSTVLLPGTLLDPKCKSCGSNPIIKESDHLYIDLQRIQSRLADWVDQQADVWRSHVSAEARKWLKEGLKQRSITRDLEWGIHLPIPEYANKVFYVWFDAPIAYVSFMESGENNERDRYWKDPSAEIYHFLGKDNIPFHTIFWPAMLLAHGEYNLPSNVVGYNYLLYKGKKFSKSKGVGVFCYNLLDTEIDIDTLRAYLTTTIPEMRDSSFSWDEYRIFVNKELIASFGNFFNRTLSMIKKSFEGIVGGGLGTTPPEDQTTIAIDAMNAFPREIGDLIMRAELRKALNAVMEYSRVGNVYLQRTEPWKTARSDPARARQSLLVALNLCRSLAIVSSPFIPHSMQRVWRDQLNLPGSPLEAGIWNSAAEMRIGEGHTIGQPSPIFSQIDEAKLDYLKERFARAHSLKELVLCGEDDEG